MISAMLCWVGLSRLLRPLLKTLFRKQHATTCKVVSNVWSKAAKDFIISLEYVTISSPAAAYNKAEIKPWDTQCSSPESVIMTLFESWHCLNYSPLGHAYSVPSWLNTRLFALPHFHVTHSLLPHINSTTGTQTTSVLYYISRTFMINIAQRV